MKKLILLPLLILIGITSTKEHYLNRRRLVGDFHGQAALLWCAVALLEK